MDRENSTIQLESGGIKIPGFLNENTFIYLPVYQTES